MNMNALITHLTYDHFVLHDSGRTFFASLAIRTIPIKPIHKLRVQRRNVALSMKLLAALIALHNIAFT